MKLIYAQGFSKNEKLEWKPVVFANIVQAFRLIYDAMNELDIKFENPENEASTAPHAKSWCPGTLLTESGTTEKHGSHHGRPRGRGT
jgi:hypothetical protein